MAIIKMGTIVVGIRGTVGGLTFTNSRSGPVAKAWSRPTRTVTGKQSDQRVKLSGWPGQWRALSSADKTAWNDWANLPDQEKTNSLGETYTISGWNWYLTVNTWREMQGLAALSTPPVGAWPSIPGISDVTFENSGGVTELTIEWGPSEFQADEAAVLFVVPIRYGGRITQTSGYRLIDVIANPGATSEDFGPAYEEVFGVPSDGDQAFIRLMKQSAEGLRSSFDSWTAVCA